MKKLDLCGSWIMTGADGHRFPAEVPGTVLKTLLDNGVIPDPFDGLNETIACDALKSVWSFERSFDVTEEQLCAAHMDLVFEGLDTLAEIVLNGRVIARTDNMHRTWRIPVREMLHAGENMIRITFSPAQTYVEKAAEENPDISYAGGSELRGTGFLRKAHYMFGWDWGPRLPDAGIWRKASLECYDIRLEEVRIHQEHSAGEVLLQVSGQSCAGRTEIELTDPDGQHVAKAAGRAGETLLLRVACPRMWWPNGLGEQPLYTLKVRLTGDGNSRTEDEKAFRVGLRTLTIHRETDEWGESFALCCNGTDFFSMGADYIPQDNLLTRMTRKRTEQLLKACRDCHFNTIRVWGGGVYPDEDFYDLCDELGLVVWQDLMFACNTYRLTQAFRESIVRETEDNVRRFRHHASLGLICGNNEMEAAWLSWGEVKDQPENLKRDYLEQFEHLLKDVCERETPDVFYWPSSPSSGGGFDDPDSLDRGDAHDWSVWHGRRPFSDFAERYPRFCSEFGFESFPCMDTLKTFVHSDREMNPFSRVMESHQKCRSGNATMLFYLAQTLRYPFSMEKLVHATQFLQAEAMRAGVEHWRRNRGRCMGAIYWQLNDCWPVASWAGIDSLGRWKALQYRAKRFFAPVAVSLQKQGQGYRVFVTNERRDSFRGKVLGFIRDERGKIIRQVTVDAGCPAMSSVPVCSMEPEKEEELKVVHCVLQNEAGETVSECEELYTLPKYFPFESPKIGIRCEGCRVTLTADTLCIGTELQSGDTIFSDNWVTLYPNEPRVLTADRELKEEELRVLWIE